jgi:hypothetical protein
MRDYLAHLPDYTCRVTVERSRRPGAQVPFELEDRLRVEVAYAGAQELFAWPGDERFERGIEALVPGRGMVSNGTYALHTRKLFLSNAAAFAPPAETDCGGEPCIRLDFAVPSISSGYSLGGNQGSAPVALAGSVWFDGASLDIRRLLVRVDDPPRTVPIAATREETVYGPVPFGDAAAVLPLSSELLLTDRNGSQSLNRSTFNQCHQFAGTATISYGSAGLSISPAAVAAPTPASTVTLPTGLDMEVALEAPVGPDLAEGDLFTARVTRAVTIPIGAVVTGRITNMRRVRNSWAIGLTLLQVEWPGSVAKAQFTLRRAYGMKPRNSLLVAARGPVLPAGFPMTWRVAP